MDEKWKRRLLMYLVQYGWRDNYESDDCSVCDPYAFQTEEEYLRAKHAWRDQYDDLDVEDYEYEDEFLASRDDE